MAPQVQLQVDVEGTGYLLADYKKMKATGKPKTEFEFAVLTLYELILHRLTYMMSPADAALIEAATAARRAASAPAPTQQPVI